MCVCVHMGIYFNLRYTLIFVRVIAYLLLLKDAHVCSYI